MTRRIAFLLLMLGCLAGFVQAQSTYTVAYSYDAQGRLTEARYGESMAITYTYDANSNLLSRVTEGPSGVAVEEDTGLPVEFALLGNYPNPFNPVTTIRFDLPEAAEVRVEVFDVLGRRVLTVPAQALAAGTGRTVTVEGGVLASGFYLYRLIARSEGRTMVDTGRMLLVK